MNWKQWLCGLRLHKRPFNRRLRTSTHADWPDNGLPTTYLEDFCSHCDEVLLRLELPRNNRSELVREQYKVPAESKCFHCGRVYAECNGRQCG